MVGFCHGGNMPEGHDCDNDDDNDDDDDDYEDDLWNWVGLAGNNFEEGETKSSCQESLDDI